MNYPLQWSLGQRVSQEVSSVVTEYLLDMQPGLWKVIAADDGTDVNRYIHDPVTGRILQHEGPSNNWNWAALDGLGTVRGVYDDTLAEAYTADRDPYGGQITSTGSNPTPFEYTGEPEDQNGLLHLRARYYDPGLAVFNSRDPVETGNRYAYVGANPINMTDPSGNFSELPSHFAPCAGQSTQDENCVSRCNPLLDPRYGGSGFGPEPYTWTDCVRDCIRASSSSTPPASTPVPTLEPVPCVPGPSGICLPTSSPTFPSVTIGAPPSPTPPSFRLPMDNARLSNCDWIVSGGATQGLRSRDMNPEGVATPSSVYAPTSEAEVWLVDTTIDNNSGLGNVVVLRIPTEDGYLYISYAHLNSVNVSANDIGERVPGSLMIGTSGNTGTIDVHLDLTVIRTPQALNANQTGYPNRPDYGPLEQDVQSLYTLGLTEEFGAQEIDPLTLWPELAEGVECP